MKRGKSDEPMVFRESIRCPGASFKYALASARELVAELAEAYDTRVWGRLNSNALPGAWRNQRCGYSDIITPKKSFSQSKIT